MVRASFCLLPCRPPPRRPGPASGGHGTTHGQSHLATDQPSRHVPGSDCLWGSEQNAEVLREALARSDPLSHTLRQANPGRGSQPFYICTYTPRSFPPTPRSSPALQQVSCCGRVCMRPVIGCGTQSTLPYIPSPLFPSPSARLLAPPPPR